MMCSMRSGSSDTKKVLAGMSGGIFLVGLGLMFYFNVGIWPWILALIGVTSFVSQLEGKGFWAGLQSLIWMVGLAVMFATGAFWPGILVLIGFSTMIGALLNPNMPGNQRRDARKSKPKRDLEEDDEIAYVMGSDGEIDIIDYADDDDDSYDQQQRANW